jgi:hypothetical protein
MTRRTPTRDECIAAAAALLMKGAARRAAMTPREAAEAAYYPGHPLGTVEAIEAEIIRRRKTQRIAWPPEANAKRAA